ncbi:hypothetical protein ERO13_D10G137450v2 [Gossypium hirsutum]|nr:hypothetical protein ERO13_D10G137450v2 [Gossypium hirsutum]
MSILSLEHLSYMAMHLTVVKCYVRKIVSSSLDRYV